MIQSVVEKKALIGASRDARSRGSRSCPRSAGEITALRLDGRGEDLFVGTSHGQVLRYDVRDPGAPEAGGGGGRRRAGRAVPVTALGFLHRRPHPGGRRRSGRRVDLAGGAAAERRRAAADAHPSSSRPTRRPSWPIAASQRDKGFATADALGGSCRVSATAPPGRRSCPSRTSAQGWPPWSSRPRATALAGGGRAGGRLAVAGSTIRIPRSRSGRCSARSGTRATPQPEYVWQSTGGTDDFESEVQPDPAHLRHAQGHRSTRCSSRCRWRSSPRSTSQFMHPAVKAYVKPMVEIMAALPSVVLGFLAGLWLAPRGRAHRARSLPDAARPAASAILAAYCWLAAPAADRSRPLPDRERRSSSCVPVVARRAPGLAFALGGLVEAALLGGQLPRLAALGARAHLRPAQLPRGRRGHGLRGDPDHLHDRRGRVLERARST